MGKCERFTLTSIYLQARFSGKRPDQESAVGYAASRLWAPVRQRILHILSLKRAEVRGDHCAVVAIVSSRTSNPPLPVQVILHYLKYPIPFLFTFDASSTCPRLSHNISSSFHNGPSTCDCCRRWLVRSQRSSYCLSKWWQRPSPRQEQLLWRQLDQSHLRYQWCSHTIASRPGNPGQCQAVLRRYSEVSS